MAESTPPTVGTVHFTSNDPQFALPDVAFSASDNGVKVVMVTLKSAGDRTITVADATRSGFSGTSNAIHVNPAAAVSLLVTGFPANPGTGVAGSVVVSAIDAFGNKTPAYHGTVHLSSSDPQAILPADFVFTNGVHTFSATLRSLGAQSFTASDTANASITGTQTGMDVVSAATHLSVTGLPATVTAGQPISITVTALDSHNQADALFQDTIHFSITGLAIPLPIDYAFVLADQGTKTFSITFTKTGRPHADGDRPDSANDQGDCTDQRQGRRCRHTDGDRLPQPDVSGTAGKVVVTRARCVRQPGVELSRQGPSQQQRPQRRPGRRLHVPAQRQRRAYLQRGHSCRSALKR